MAASAAHISSICEAQPHNNMSEQESRHGLGSGASVSPADSARRRPDSEASRRADDLASYFIRTLSADVTSGRGVTSPSTEVAASDPPVTFNVGGRLFTTRRSTVMSRHSALAVLLREDNDRRGPQGRTDANGVYFFDRSPVYFEMLLNCLRTEKIIPPENRSDQLQLLLEAEYFAMDAVASSLRLSLGVDESFSLSDSQMYEYPVEADPMSSQEGPLQGIVTDGLVACLDANDPRTLTHGGHRWHDSSGQGNDAHFPPTAPLYIPNHTCAAFRFSSDVHRTLAPLDITPSATPACTIEAWVKLRAITTGLGCLVTNGTSQHCRAIHLHDRSAGQTNGLGSVCVVSGEHRLIAGGPPPLGRWLHIVAVWFPDGSVKAYRDGRIAGSIPALAHAAVSCDSDGDDEYEEGSRIIAIGAHHLLGNSHIDGSIAVIRVYARALAEYEITDNYYSHARRFSHGLS